ncbi:alpha/beta hydrolase fold domain-containing protein [Nonomuraea helvata]|uniref:Alpha/beta hydrolase fold domain-containing protein n=1 Tax=Nonomuraea helvata TaxID=37484 RepID=A0ABV5RY07_9ACTN
MGVHGPQQAHEHDHDPGHPFPAPVRQVFEVVQWVAEHGAEHGWDGTRLTVGGQSAGGALAAVARQALEQGGPPIALQVLHYPPLDLVTPAKDKRSAIAKPMLRPWMGEVFDNAYAPDQGIRADRLASPAHPADTADLTGIAPALVITPEYDRLHAEGSQYAQRLHKAGALAEHHDVPRADHAYDMNDADKARQSYALIARHLRQATTLGACDGVTQPGKPGNISHTCSPVTCSSPPRAPACSTCTPASGMTGLWTSRGRRRRGRRLRGRCRGCRDCRMKVLSFRGGGSLPGYCCRSRRSGMAGGHSI